MSTCDKPPLNVVHPAFPVAPQVGMPTSFQQPNHFTLARGHANHAPSQSRVSSDPLELVPANPNEAAPSSQASPPVHPCSPVCEQAPATVVPTHTRTALARPGIKIACDIAASSPAAPCARALPSILFNSHDAKCAADCLVANCDVRSWPDTQKTTLQSFRGHTLDRNCCESDGTSQCRVNGAERR